VHHTAPLGVGDATADYGGVLRASATMQNMTSDWEVAADEVLTELQDRVTARDLPRLLDLFEDPAVLIGTSGDGRTPGSRTQYLASIVTQNAGVQWAWAEKHLFYESDGALGFAAFGEIILTEAEIESRAPFRLTLFVIRAPDGWRIRQFHGSVPKNTATN
jgi:ketosteroid isomerase-like protein